MKNKDNYNKLRGGYYTPPEIAHFLAQWVLNGSTKKHTILEPSMGDGAIILPLIEELEKRNYKKNDIAKSIYGIELFQKELDIAKDKIKNHKNNPEKFNFFTGDFFTIFDKQLRDVQFDIILGNPPFIRYQNFPEKQRDKAVKILTKNGFHPNKMTNAWLLFLVASILKLKKDGKLAMVIPAELLQVGYASEARVFLSNFFHSITIVSFKKLAFEGIQQEVILLLCDRSKKSSKGINFIELFDINQLPPLAEIKSPSRFKPIQHDTDKWTQYFLNNSEILLLRKLQKNPMISRLGELVDVDVGVVTGKNNFFVVSKEIVNKYKLNKYVIPLVGRTAQINGSFYFTKEKWNKLKNDNGLCYLFSYNNKLNTKSPVGVKEYINKGIEQEVQKGYKCSIRKLWHSVPSIWVPDALLFRQVHEFPKLVLNKAKAVPTDTIHRVRLKEDIKGDKLSASFHNSLTFAFSEVFGRSYGGGVLELEPSEAEALLVPYLKNKDIDLKKIEKLKITGGISAVLDYADKLLLEQGLGLSKNDIIKLRGIWKKLSNRRTNRKKA